MVCVWITKFQDPMTFLCFGLRITKIIRVKTWTWFHHPFCLFTYYSYCSKTYSILSKKKVFEEIEFEESLFIFILQSSQIHEFWIVSRGKYREYACELELLSSRNSMARRLKLRLFELLPNLSWKLEILSN